MLQLLKEDILYLTYYYSGLFISICASMCMCAGYAYTEFRVKEFVLFENSMRYLSNEVTSLNRVSKTLYAYTYSCLEYLSQ